MACCHSCQPHECGDEGGEARGEFFIARCDSAEVLDAAEMAFNEIAMLNVKEPTLKTRADLTPDGHWRVKRVNQAAAGMKPKRVRALIQRGALR